MLCDKCHERAFEEAKQNYEHTITRAERIKLEGLENTLKQISEMPIVRGIGPVETRYNNVIELAKDAYTTYCK